MIDDETAQRIGEVIAPRWPWRPGCFVQRRTAGWVWPGARIYAVHHADDGVWLICHPESDPTATWHIPVDGAWPDFRDAATLGHLDESVNHVHGSAGPMFAAHLPFMAEWPNVWTVVSTGDQMRTVGGWHPSKAEALVAAWLDADGERGRT